MRYESSIGQFVVWLLYFTRQSYNIDFLVLRTYIARLVSMLREVIPVANQ